MQQHHPSFEALCLPHRSMLRGSAMRLARNPNDADDLVQETLKKAFQNWASFQPERAADPLQAASTWLQGILFNAFVSSYRHRARRIRFDEDVLAVLTASHGAPQATSTGVPAYMPVDSHGNELSDEVIRALANLSAEYREVVERADLRGEKYRDIASTLGVPIGTVMSRLHRARRLLAAALEEFAAAHYGLRRSSGSAAEGASPGEHLPGPCYARSSLG